MPDAVITALTATGLSFAHHAWAKAPEGDYGIYTEWGENSLYADDKHAERAAQFSVHYYTRDPSGTAKESIEAALDSCGAAWYVDLIDFESDTGFLHYEWACEL